MASIVYDSYMDDLAGGLIIPNTDTFKVMLLTSGYTPNKTTHLKRSDLSSEVVGAGYTAGGSVAVVSAVKDTTNNREDIELGGVTWATATITARYAVYYKSRGGAASADNLLCVIDFGSDVVSTAGNFVLSASILRTQN